MPNIRIDDQVYRFLQRHAEPLADTPNSVLRRLFRLDADVPDTDPGEPLRHQRASKSAPQKSRQPRSSKGQKQTNEGPMLAENDYMEAILDVLRERGGEAAAAEVVEAVGERLRERLTAADQETLPSGAVRWQSRTHFGRLKLVEKGRLKRKSPRGIWQLTSGANDAKASIE